MREYTDKEFWNNYWKNENRDKDDGFYFDKIISKTIDFNITNTYLEVGGAPGSIMKHIQEKYGLDVSTIDFSDKSITENYLHDAGVKNYHIYEEDFSKFDVRSLHQKYDIVASWGFIEHFSRKMSSLFIKKQKYLVEKEGYLIVELPNIRRLMWLIYFIFNRDLIKIHNLKIMDIKWLRNEVLRGGKFSMLYSGYYFAMNPENEFFMHHKVLEGFCKRLVDRFQEAKMPETMKSFFYPYIILIAKKKA